MKIFNIILLLTIGLASFAAETKDHKSSNAKPVEAVETISFKHYMLAMVEDADSENVAYEGLEVVLMDEEDEDCSTVILETLPLQTEDDEESVVITLN